MFYRMLPKETSKTYPISNKCRHEEKRVIANWVLTGGFIYGERVAKCLPSKFSSFKFFTLKGVLQRGNIKFRRCLVVTVLLLSLLLLLLSSRSPLARFQSHLAWQSQSNGLPSSKSVSRLGEAESDKTNDLDEVNLKRIWRLLKKLERLFINISFFLQL